MYPWPAAARTVPQALDPVDGEPATPGPHGVHADVQGLGDRRVRRTVSDLQHDLRPQSVAVLGATGRHPGGQRPILGRGQDNQVRARHRHWIFVSHHRPGTVARHAVNPAVGEDDVVAKYPDSTKSSLEYRLHARARDRWPQLTTGEVRHRGTHPPARSAPPPPHRPLRLTPPPPPPPHFGINVWPAALRRVGPPMGL